MKQVFARVRTMVTAAAVLTLWTACAAQHPAGKPNPYEPRAVALLQEMADAYTHLSSLRQETEFNSAMMPLIPLPVVPPAADETDGQGRRPKDPLNAEHKLDRKLRLAYAAPNRLRLEVEDTDEYGKLQLSTWVSDGKSFWTYNPEKNLFSREKAPGNIRDFAKLAHMTSGSLEVLMLMGINPFARIEEQTEGVRCTGRATVGGVDSEVVAMTADLGPMATETRLYIGVEDHLLHRLVSETSQKAHAPMRVATGSPLDELAPPEPSSLPLPGNPEDPPALPGVLMKSRLTCDNVLDVDPKFVADAFAYQPPAGALFLTSPDPHKKPMTMKQRIAELNRATGKQKKQPVKVIRVTPGP